MRRQLLTQGYAPPGDVQKSYEPRCYNAVTRGPRKLSEE
jgi:hypothetical protein